MTGCEKHCVNQVAKITNTTIHEAADHSKSDWRQTRVASKIFRKFRSEWENADIVAVRGSRQLAKKTMLGNNQFFPNNRCRYKSTFLEGWKRFRRKYVWDGVWGELCNEDSVQRERMGTYHVSACFLYFIFYFLY